LFNTFTKIDRYRDLNKEGVGLGLVICKNLVEALGGNIKVESSVGKGSKFILEIPENPNFSLPTINEQLEIKLSEEIKEQQAVVSISSIDLDLELRRDAEFRKFEI
jgi:chemotaxis protein histidine kinase CheA